MLNDGGAARQNGWGRIDPALGDVNGLPRATLAPALYGEVKTLRIYDRALTTSETIGNFHHGRNN